VEKIPSAVLSEQFQERMSGRRLLSAVFLTFQFEPGFFEQEVLPALLDVPLSHAKPIRLLQLEDALRAPLRHVAVYYDSNGLIEGSGSAKLDVRRVPVRHPTGIAHAKNVLLLVEAEEPDDAGHRPRALVVASLSANLTRSGWWENVEACHIEEVAEGEKTSLKDDLSALLKRVRKARSDTPHEALDEVLAFLKSTEQRGQKSVNGQLYTQLYRGDEPLADFLARVAGDAISGMSLEVISPFFDDADECAPLKKLIADFHPKQVRVYLPLARTGEVACRATLFESVRALPNVEWGKLPRGILRMGKGDDVKERFVHAKVYRFFGASPKREIVFVGSANLTNAGHNDGGNWETGFLVDRTPARRPEFWLEPLEADHAPSGFRVECEDEAAATARGTPLNLRYHWNESRAEAFWDAKEPSPLLHLSARGVDVGTLNSLPSRAWTPLDDETAKRVGSTLAETSLLEVRTGGAVAWLLVQEEGMSHKPSLLLQLSAADILRYWALLTADQRAAFLESRALSGSLAKVLADEGTELLAKAKIVIEDDTVFDRFAGFFHAFGCLERTVRESLVADREKEADYRLFGKKYDSLGALLDRVSTDGAGDGVDQYVLLLCARQLCNEIGRTFPDYWKKNKAAASELEARCGASLKAVRRRLTEQNPANDFAAFLDWFDRWFLRRAAPVKVEA
jgi:hypothetical protein